MVNEVNKPPSPENIILGERLAASHRQLQEMQEEHRQLLQEMEMLRQRAAELSRLNEQQDELERNRANALLARNAQAPIPQPANSDATESDTLTESVRTTATVTTESELAPPSKTTDEACDTPATSAPTHTTTADDTAPNADAEEDDPETAEYLQEKLAEISALKARYKRVHNMMNTTELIEKHIASKDVSSTSTVRPAATTPITTAQSGGDAIVAAAPPPPTQIAPDSNANTHLANEELLSTMMNMFTDFTSDLRSQAEDLRAERDRIRALKEDLLRRKQQS